MNRAQRHAAVGFTVKSGWAACVLVAGSTQSLSVLESRRIELSDPANPDARQPYHAGFGTARNVDAELKQLVSSVKRYGRQSASAVIREFRGAGHQMRGAGIIVGSLIDPDQIANDHIRIHALEGKLFRTVVQDAVTKDGLSCSIWRERDLYDLARQVLKRPEVEIRSTLGELGRHIEGPWRAEQKVAALGAWLVLAGR